MGRRIAEILVCLIIMLLGAAFAYTQGQPLVQTHGWIWGPSASGAATNPLEDLVAAPDPAVYTTMNPLPTCNGQNTGATRYMSVPQTIRVGTNAGGSGSLVQTDVLGYYLDHGQHDSIQVPTQPSQ